MKVLIISYFNSWATHFATELELAQIHLDQGDTVEFLGCDRALGTCEANPSGKISKCDKCRLRRSRGLGFLTCRPELHLLGDYLPAAAHADIAGVDQAIRDAGTAADYTYNGHDLGNGALSSAIWKSRDPFCETSHSLKVLNSYAKSALRSYLSVRAFLAANPGIDLAYVFSGRFASTRGALRACQEVAGLQVITHERGPHVGKYSLYPNTMPHDRKLWVQQAQLAWQQAGDREHAIAIGSGFFAERRHGQNVDWTSFTGKQAAGKLPAGWLTTRKNVAIFNSSEDEFVGLGDEWRNPIYTTQAEGIRHIVEDARSRYPEVQFYLRMHPNLTGVMNREIEMVNAMDGSAAPNLVIIPPDSDISTYAVLDAADQIITFGSTVGVEATFWGKPSIHAGRSFYEDLGAVYVAQSHTHLMDLLATAVEPMPQINAIKYGYHARTFGEDFRYWKAQDFSNGSFRGHPIKCEPTSWLVRRAIVWASDALPWASL